MTYIGDMTDSSTTSRLGARNALLALTAIAQVLSGALAAYVTYVLVPDARESLRWGLASIGLAVEPVVVPIGLAIGAYLLVGRVGHPTMDGTAIVALFVLSFVAYYVGFWGMGIPTPTPGRVPLGDDLALWLLFERSPYLPYAWSNFLVPGVDGGLAALAGIGAASLRRQ
jgi:hypothetical protein